MSIKNHLTCVAPTIGAHLMEFELDCQSEAERQEFEKHLLICDFCFEEVEKMQMLSTALVANRRQVSVKLEVAQKRSTEFSENLRLEPARVRRHESGHRFLEWLLGPKVAWSFASVAAILIVVWVNMSSISTPDTSAFGPIRWNVRQIVRGDATFEQYDRAGDAYRSGDFATAESLLESISGQNSKSEVWLYLGASRFMLAEYESAIHALEIAKLGGGEIETEARFYTAICYLRQDAPHKAKAILEELVAQRTSRISDAEKLLSEM